MPYHRENNLKVMIKFVLFFKNFHFFAKDLRKVKMISCTLVF